jgi:hypothetical protein
MNIHLRRELWELMQLQKVPFKKGGQLIVPNQLSLLNFRSHFGLITRGRGLTNLSGLNF